MEDVIKSLDEALYKIHQINCDLYEFNVSILTDDDLATEFEETFWPDKYEDVSWMGREYVESRLVDKYCSTSYNKLIGSLS